MKDTSQMLKHRPELQHIARSRSHTLRMLYADCFADDAQASFPGDKCCQSFILDGNNTYPFGFCQTTCNRCPCAAPPLTCVRAVREQCVSDESATR